MNQTAVKDQLWSDLASLRIERSAPRARSGALGKLLALAAAGAACAGAYVAWYPSVRGEIWKTEVAVTEVATVSPVQSSVLVTATGYIVPQLTSKVGPHETGRLRRVLVKEGDAVKAGQVIAEMETFDQRSALAAASSRVSVAEARVATAQATLAETAQKVRRERVLVEHAAEAKSVLEDLEAQEASLRESVNAAQAEVKAAEAEQATLRVFLGERTVVAPIDGTVVAKPMMAGEVTSPGAPDPIVELVDFASLLAEVDVPENRVASIAIGGPAEVTLDAYPDHPLRGHVVELGKRVDRSKATLVVKVKLEPDTVKVLPEMSARASFLSAPVTDEALRAAPKKVVAPDAVVERGGRKVVFAIADGAAHAVPVTTGSAVGSSVELLEGPPNGARVVSAPPAALRDGTKIKEKGM
jgi:HlyD family secretion protein